MVHDGDVVALEGFTHLIPFRRRARNHPAGAAQFDADPDDAGSDLRSTDRLGLRVEAHFSWGGNPGVGSLHRLRDAVEQGWPAPLALEENAHAGMAAAYAAGASHLPFGMLRGYLGTDLPKYNHDKVHRMSLHRREVWPPIPAIRPDVTVIHAQKADRKGNVLMWGVVGVQKEAVLAAKRAIVTVEEIVDELDAPPNCRGAAFLGGGRGVRSEGRSVSVLRARLLSAQQRVLQTMGRDRARARDVPGLDATHVLGTKDFDEFKRSLEAAVTMPEAKYTADEMMTIAAARMIRNGASCFVGIGLPSAAANLARLTHAPDTVLIYESGRIGTKPTVLPLSIGDGELSETADTVVSIPEMFAYWLQGGRIDLGFLGAAQIDRFANINTTVIGDYHKPTVRLPGAGGAPEIAASSKEVLITLRQNKRAFVEKLDFVTSGGHFDRWRQPREDGSPGKGPTAVITDLGIMTPDPRRPRS